MRTLIPRVVVDWIEAGEHSGQIQAAALFVDISGFTAVTEVLMAHQRAGAEALAEVMEAVFAPLIAAVYGQGGFISGFAGDAFTAVFPASADYPLRALAAAWAILNRFDANYRTPFGNFQFGVKVGLAVGEVAWGIAGGLTAYFRGPAIDDCAAAEQRAAGDQLVLTGTARGLLDDLLTAEPVGDDFWRVTAVVDRLPAAQPFREDAPAGQAAFVSAELLQMTARGEFRQVVTLFVNLQGSPSDEELEALMTAVGGLLNEYDGYLCRLDFGDKGCNLLLFWGAPVAHENDIARTLDFALALRQLSPRPLRMGITYRLAYAGFAGSMLRSEYTCYGLSVNLAARLMAQAPWDAIWLDAAVMERAAGFELVGTGQFAFKGFSEKQAVYRLEGREAYAIDRPFYEGELVGRAAELARMEQALSGLGDGRFGGVLLVEGEAGIGKSRLAHAALRRVADATSARVFLCQTDEILRRPLNPLRYMLRRTFRQHPALNEAENKRRFEAGMRRLLRRTSDIALAKELERTASFLGALLDLFWPDSLYAQLEPELRFENTLDALKVFFRAEAVAQPVIVHVEDAQWLDAESEQFIARLLRNIAAVPLALVLTSRSRLVREMFGTVEPVEVGLGSLPNTAVGKLIADLLDDTPAPELVTLLQARSEGNPFYVEQLVRFLQEQDLLYASAEGVTTDTAARNLPVDIQAVLIARLDRLSREVRDVVQTAAVLGREFEVRVLSEMLRNDRELALKLELAEGAAVWSALSELRYIFRHALLRDAAYQMQLESRLAALHRLAADAIEGAYADDLSPYYADLVYHYGRGGDNGRELLYARLAAEQARTRYANQDALTYIERALALLPEEDTAARFDLLLMREGLHATLGARAAQEQDLQALEMLMSATGDAGEQVQRQMTVLLRRARLADDVGSYDAALEAARAATAVARTAGDSEKLADAFVAQSIALWHQDAYDEARPLLHEAVALARQEGLRELEADSLNTLGLIALYQNEYETADSHLQQALMLYRRLGNRRGEALVINSMGIIARETRVQEQMRAYFEASRAIFHEIGHRWGESGLLNNLGLVYYDQANYERARHYFALALVQCQEIDNRQMVAVTHSNIGLCDYHLGQFDQAAEQLEQALTLAEQIGDKRTVAMVLENRATLLLEVGQPGRAQAAAERALEIVQEIGRRDSQCSCLTLMGVAQALRGEPEASLSKFEAAIDIGTEMELEHLAIEARAGRIRAWMAAERYRAALEDANAVLSFLAEGGIDGVEDPLQMYATCLAVLEANGDDRITAVAETAHMLLLDRARLTEDAALRETFLSGVQSHRDLLTFYQIYVDKSSS